MTEIEKGTSRMFPWTGYVAELKATRRLRDGDGFAVDEAVATSCAVEFIRKHRRMFRN